LKIFAKKRNIHWSLKIDFKFKFYKHFPSNRIWCGLTKIQVSISKLQIKKLEQLGKSWNQNFHNFFTCDKALGWGHYQNSMPNLGCVLGWASYPSDNKLKVDIGRTFVCFFCFHNSKWNVKHPYKGLCKGVSFLWICVFSKLVFILF
jgi:hypothetical protein